MCIRDRLERVDWMRDLHFQTKTTIDTLDYSGSGWNSGSKLVIASCGDKKRSLQSNLPDGFNLPSIFSKPSFPLPGILAIKGPEFKDLNTSKKEMNDLTNSLQQQSIKGIPLILIVDDSEFVSAELNNFLWVTFTRANPSHDVYGVDQITEFKHWGCRGALIIDARIKPHHAPELIKDDRITKKVDKLFKKGGELYGMI